MDTFEYKIEKIFTENENVKSCLIENDIFYCYHKPDRISDVKDLEMVFKGFLDHLEKSGKIHKIIIELAPHSSLTQEARSFLENHKEKAICEAIITYNLAQRIIINFYFKFKSHLHPSKAFKNRKSALDWVNTF